MSIIPNSQYPNCICSEDTTSKSTRNPHITTTTATTTTTTTTTTIPLSSITHVSNRISRIPETTSKSFTGLLTFK